jgi:gamma-glutamyltranspeptidase/glutathione hydrolase
MVPTLVFEDGRPTHAIGALGGAVIVSAVFQAGMNVLDFAMSATEAVQAPRLHCEGGKVFLEARIRSDYAADLERRGHAVDRPHAPFSPIMAKAQIVSMRPDGALDAGADPRGGGGGVAFARG